MSRKIHWKLPAMTFMPMPGEHITALMQKLVLSLMFYRCISSAERPDLYRFASKTAYRFVNDQAVHDNLKKHIQKHESGNCRPVQIVGFVRHGARNPGPAEIVTLNKLFTEQIMQHNSDPEILSWKSRFHINTAKDIVEAGIQEQKQLGRRFSEYFPELFSRDTSLLFRTSDKNRTVASCVAFQDGLRPDKPPRYTIRNDLMRFFAMCVKYLKDVENNPYALEECKKFKNGKELQQVGRKVAQRLDLEDIYEISPKDLKALFVVAGTELAAFKHSVWAKLFDEDDMNIMEYSLDLKAYWKKAYGHLINYQQACLLLVELFKFMDARIQGEEQSPAAVFHFGHAETILPVLCLLGLYRDPDPLTSERINLQRMFCSTEIMPFSANIAVVLYRCSADKPGYYIEVIHNERPLTLPVCPTNTMCSYETFKEHLSMWTENCDMNEICGGMKDEL